MLTLRFAAPQDASALLEIYAQYIESSITFEYALPTQAEFAARIEAFGADYPYLVLEDGGRAVGYAYAHRHRERQAYQWNTELSVYVDAAHVSKGIGGKLYAALTELLRLQGVRTAYGFVRLPNEKSERLHLSQGFARVGTYHHSGYKCGAWQDIGIFERELLPHDDAPAPVVPVWKLPEEEVRAILARVSGEKASQNG